MYASDTEDHLNRRRTPRLRTPWAIWGLAWLVGPSLCGCELLLGIEELEHEPATDATAPDSTGPPPLDAAADARVDAHVDALPSMTLAERGLLVRYHIDENDSSGGTAGLCDSAADPFHLALQNSSNMKFTDDGGRVGLEWMAAGNSGGAVGPINGTKVYSRLNSDTSLTLELVFDIRNIDDGDSYFLRFGGSNSDTEVLSLESDTDGVVELVWDNLASVAEWSVPFGAGRVVVHLVIDTMLDSGLRLQMYLNGNPIEMEKDSSGVGPGKTLELDPAHLLSLGNRPGGNNSMRGTLYYAAIYDEALWSNEVSSNAALLMIDDDVPGCDPTP